MTETPSIPVTPTPPTRQRHPRGLRTLFFTEMWERFSFYGMRGLLILFMTREITSGGLSGMGLTDPMAGAIYGLYTASVYLLCLPGGWLADRFFGAQKAVWYGGIIIATGHFCMALPRNETFFLGLMLVAMGTGLLKPNISAMVGDLYPEGGARRDAGFSIYYMGINLGAFLAPLVCGFLGEGFNWHYGFAAAGVGMVLGLIQFHFTRHHLGNAGLRPEHETKLGPFGRIGIASGLALLVALIALCASGVIRFKDPTAFLAGDIINLPSLAAQVQQPTNKVSQIIAARLPEDTRVALSTNSSWVGTNSDSIRKAMVGTLNEVIHTNLISEAEDFSGTKLSSEARTLIVQLNRKLVEDSYGKALATKQINLVAIAEATALAIVAVAVLYFTCVFLFFGLNTGEKKRVGVILVLFITSALFWAGFEQAGSSFNLFADRYTDRKISFLNFILPARLDNFEFPASWFQSVGPIMVIVLAPFMAALWVTLGRRNLDPSIPLKFGSGLILLAAGFLVMAGAARLVAAGHSVWPTWLLMTYLLHTFGELCLSPVGLSSVTKLAPKRLVGQMMGTWFLATSLGNLVAGILAGRLKAEGLEQMPSRFLQMVILPIVAGLIVILLAKPIKKLMAGVK